MNSLISFIPLLVILIIIPPILAGFFKLSARLLRRRIVTWKHCFLFGFILTLFGMVGGPLLYACGISSTVPLVFVPVFVLQVGLGAWFFSQRATYADGRKLGWRGGAELTALAVFFIMAFAISLLVISSHLLSRGVQ